MNIKVDVLGTDNYFICASTELYQVNVTAHNTTLDDAIGIAKDLILHHNFVSADILDDCGVVIAEAYKEEEKELDEDLSDRYWELGYNPYMGECDYDC